MADTIATKTIKLFTNQHIGASTGINPTAYTAIDGYRFVNIFVEFTQLGPTEPPVNIGTIFGFDANGTLGARSYVTLQDNVASPQSVNFISVTGQNTWHGSPQNTSSYCLRIPVMGPFVQVFIYNTHTAARQVSVWVYLTA